MLGVDPWMLPESVKQLFLTCMFYATPYRMPPIIYFFVFATQHSQLTDEAGL